MLDRLGLQVKVFEKGLIKLGFINMFDAWLRATSFFWRGCRSDGTFGDC